ncbi:unnamed protein product [Dibothriocephalus latus]|uniref:Uncharacterized protein n=1 Tax=Dibothriocephalus latus TaxID=60516 RepID=A0A3P7L1U2_DIBLA|nr:unnamed protein product [Dibothriocephalus latus]
MDCYLTIIMPNPRLYVKDGRHQIEGFIVHKIPICSLHQTAMSEKHLIQREHLLYDSLSRAGMSNPHLECLRRERLLGMKGVIERYELCLRAMVDRAGPNFKRCTERKNSELDFVPTNLHVNRIGLLDSENNLGEFTVL